MASDRVRFALVLAGATLVCGGIAAAAFVQAQPPPAVVLVASQEGDRVRLAFAATQTTSIELIEHLGDGRQRVIISAASPTFVRVANGTRRAMRYEVIAKDRFGRLARDTADANVRVALGPSPRIPRPASSEMEITVRSYYDDWNRHRLTEMWGRLSPAFVARTNRVKWIDDHSHETSIAVTSARVVGDRRIRAVIASTSSDAAGHPTKNTSVVTWTLISRNGRWLLDDAKQ